MIDGSATAARNIVEMMKRNYGRLQTQRQVALRDFGHLDLAAYQRFADRMTDLGFVQVADYEIPEVSNSPGSLIMPTVVRCFASGDGQIVAYYYQIKPHMGRRWRTLLRGLLNLRWIDAPLDFFGNLATREIVEFGTEFSQGDWVMTSTAQQAGMIGQPASYDQCFLPANTTPTALLERHRQRLAARLQTTPTLQFKPIRNFADVQALSARLNAIKNAHRAAIGWITREELLAFCKGNAEQADAVYAEVLKLRVADNAAR
ncbi:hypothetical protein SAMN02745857_00927 [Andreprevotia lacus DSM 23236]|jgi:hypothetical protein|uniref:Uncharacterized protein n=1 Tax=Andreprevotia lacus DSM 23236 TaxID=1121001 RepID=A0A1W1X8R7_9NEIS|nr:hypothetical protein [Andreprevotia lacus]SMC20375.1 hypothetical protein SAMN02745857_00927 [Andreprevotia lacus DSM 23236]